MSTLNNDVLDGYILGVALSLLDEFGKCNSSEVHYRAQKVVSEVSKKRCTMVLNHMTEKYRFLGINKDPRDDHVLRIEPATQWYKKSRMFLRLYDNFAAKKRIAQLVAKEISTTLHGQPGPVAYFDAGSTTLHCARECGSMMSQWTILTNNLLLASELIHDDPKPRCYLAAGEADLATAAIVESNAEEFERWFSANNVKVSVVSFHWLLATEDNSLTFVAELANEEQSKVLAVKCAQKKVVIPLTTDKFNSTGKQKRKLLQYRDGEWTSLITGGDGSKLDLPEVVLCLDKKMEQLEEPYRSALAEMSKNDKVSVRTK